jgi:hypothetical protein
MPLYQVILKHRDNGSFACEYHHGSVFLFLSSTFKRRTFEMIVAQVKVTLRLTVSQSACLGVKPKSGTFDQRFFFKVTVLSFWGALSDERSGLSSWLEFI